MVPDRRNVSIELEYQVNICSSHKNNSQKYAILAHQPVARSANKNKRCNVAIFDTIDVEKHFCDIEDARYLRDAVSVNYDEKNYLEQYRDYIFF